MKQKRIAELREICQELIDFGNSREKARGQGMLEVLNELAEKVTPTQKRSCPECGSIRVGTPTDKKVDFATSTVLMECFNPKCKHIGDQSLF